MRTFIIGKEENHATVAPAVEHVTGYQAEHWPGVFDIGSPWEGCTQAWRNLAQYAIDHDLERICVFEDDVIFSRAAAAMFERNREVLENEEFAFVYLGGNMPQRFWDWYREDGSPNDAMMRIQYMLTTHAMVLHRSSFHLIASIPHYRDIRAWQTWSKRYGVIDWYLSNQWLQCKHMKFFCFNPMIAAQRDFFNEDMTGPATKMQDSLWQNIDPEDYKWSLMPKTTESSTETDG